jgi:hypothetical protein
MTQTSRNGSHSAASPQELRAEVEQARDELADTVAQLAAKADFKSRAQLRAQQTRAKMHRGQEDQATGESGGKPGVMTAAGAGVLALIALAAVLHRRRRS